MIGSVRGRVIARGTDHVVVEVAGVGYKVFVPRQPQTDDVLLHTQHVVREDGQLLFGFATRDELALFELLTSVSGVGPRAALALLSVSGPPELAAAIAGGDVAALARAPGVGKKTAERLIVDLRQVSSGLERALEDLASDVSRTGDQQRTLLGAVSNLEKMTDEVVVSVRARKAGGQPAIPSATDRAS